MDGEMLQLSINNVWILVTAFLVFFMQAGFAMVEGGFVRAKSVGNVLMKNLMDFSMGTLSFWAIGFGLMQGADSMGLFGTDSFFLSPEVTDMASGGTYTFFLFQLVFAATAATIVSGAMAERTKFISYLIYSFIVSLVIYPIQGHWVWGGGWLSTFDLFPGNEVSGYLDFAGSSVVHMVGGILGFIGAAFLGPRIGKYKSNGEAVPIPGHNIPIAALGVFILWFGWYGFNPGSELAADQAIGFIAVTTTIGAAAGAVFAMFFSWIVLKTPDIGMTLNGALAGLVAITAPCAGVSPLSSIIIGGVAGILVVCSVIFIERVLKVDDPVGAVSVHGVCGFWGVISVGLFDFGKGLFTGNGIEGLLIQLIGALSIALWTIVTGVILFGIIKATIGLRVTEEEEKMGLDLGEHKAEAYPNFKKDFIRE